MIKSKKHVVIGVGDVGQALIELGMNKGIDMEGLDIKHSTKPKPPTDVMHICFPYSKRFVDDAVDYINEYSPSIAFIHSTVLPGTTARIDNEVDSLVVYSPVRGQHNNLRTDMLRYSKWIAAYSAEALMNASETLQLMGFRPIAHNVSPEQLELIKLLDTTQYAVLIAWAQEAQRFCDRIELSHSLLRRFGEETHTHYGVRPDIHPSYIGGHCLIPNVKILRGIKKSMILDSVLSSNTEKGIESD